MTKNIENKYPLVSIISINFNTAKYTNQLLHSLTKVTWPNLEVIVVDNASELNDFNKINAGSYNVKIIRNTKNLGFAGGNNVGILQSKGEFILLLNNDTEVAPGFIEPMVRLFQFFKKVGAVSPKIKYYQSPKTIQYAGFTEINPFTLRMNAIGHKQTDNGQFNKVSETPFAHGCALMVRRKVIPKAGLMPEDYFLYYEEHDWSLSIRKAGYGILYCPQSEVFHKESMSVKKESVLKTYYLNRNRILFMSRNFKKRFKILAWVYLLFISVPRNAIRYLLRFQFEHLLAYRNAIAWNIKHSLTNK